jgi:gliding motility-associated-like protein
VKDSVFVKVVQPFTLVATQRYSACKDATIQLSASGAPNYLWSPATGLSAVNISNPRATVSGNQTYSVIGYDTAGCFADTALVSVEVVAPPTVELGPDLVIPVGNTHTFVPVVSSDVTAYLWSPAINLSCSTCPNPILNSRENTTYNLKVTNTTGCSATDSVRVIVTCGSSSVFIPNTFSPNGDGSNDVFYPRGKGIYNIQYLRIFNRWGQLVFDRKNLTVNDPASGWNGLINGKAADGGVYTYFMEVTCNNNQTLKYFGNLNLIQ